MDERLDQTITVNEKGDRLDAVLARLSEKTGLKLYAHAPLYWAKVLIHYTGTLRGLMDALTHFFATDKDHPAEWIDENKGRYTLARTYEGQCAIRELVKKRQEALDAGMNRALQDGNRWVKHLGFLTDAERRWIYDGNLVARTADFYGGRGFLKEVLRDDEPNWSDQVNVTYEMKGHSPLTRVLHRRLEDMEHGTIVTETFTVAQLCPQLAPETQQRDWVLHYGDPQPRGRKTVQDPYRDKTEDTLPRREVLFRIAEDAGVNLIADDFGQELRRGLFAINASLSLVLDAACKFQYGSGQTPDTNHGSFWRKVGDTFLVRSIAWPEEAGQG